MYILDRMRDFCIQAQDTSSVAAAKQLVVLIDRVVRRGLCSPFLYHLTLDTAHGRGSHEDLDHACATAATVDSPEKLEEDQVT